MNDYMQQATDTMAKMLEKQTFEWAKANPAAVERAKRRADLKRRIKKKLKAAQRLMREIAELDAEPFPQEPGFSSPSVKIGDTITVKRPERWAETADETRSSQP